MNDSGLYSWRNPWFRGSMLTLVALTVLSIIVGFIVLPSVQADYTSQGLWASICRSAGVPGSWSSGDTNNSKADPLSTMVVLDRTMAHKGADDSVGRGATLALNCTMCHGAQGMSVANAPNLAGQYPEVVVKQLRDYKSGNRSSSVMEALAQRLADKDMGDLAAYYTSLPKARTVPTTYDENLPALVRVGAPLRNIAPCISCHGGVDQKFGAPWLEGMPKDYLVAQLSAFASSQRRNDSHAQMRNVAFAMTPQEIEEVSIFYARKTHGVASTP